MAKKWDANTIRLLNLGPTAAWRTQAVYQATAEMLTVDAPDTIIICQPLSPYLSLGYEQLYDAVLDRAQCESRHLPVVRQRINGEVAYWDSNQLLFQAVFHHSRVPQEGDALDVRMLTGVATTLQRIGLNAQPEAEQEVGVAGKQIAALQSGRIGEAVVVVGRLFFDFDYATISHVWRAPNQAFHALATTALREQITTIWRESGPITPEAVLWMLLEDFAKAWERPIERGTPKQAETRHSRSVAEQITSPEYLNLHNDVVNGNGRIPPTHTLKISAAVSIKWAEVAWNGRTVQGSFRVREDIIEEAQLQSNPMYDWSKTEANLRGIAFQEWQHSLPAD